MESGAHPSTQISLYNTNSLDEEVAPYSDEALEAKAVYYGAAALSDFSPNVNPYIILVPGVSPAVAGVRDSVEQKPYGIHTYEGEKKGKKNVLAKQGRCNSWSY